MIFQYVNICDIANKIVLCITKIIKFVEIEKTES